MLRLVTHKCNDHTRDDDDELAFEHGSKAFKFNRKRITINRMGSFLLRPMTPHLDEIVSFKSRPESDNKCSPSRIPGSSLSSDSESPCAV